MRKMSTAARDELVTALARRYAVCTRAKKTQILDEFEAVTDFHRKLAMHVRHTGAARPGRAGASPARLNTGGAHLMVLLRIGEPPPIKGEGAEGVRADGADDRQLGAAGGTATRAGAATV